MRVITIDGDNVVISVRYVGDNCILGESDYVSDIGELGQIRVQDGSFVTPQPDEENPQPSEIDLLKTDNAYLKSRVADQTQTMSDLMDILFSNVPELMNL